MVNEVRTRLLELLPVAVSFWTCRESQTLIDFSRILSSTTNLSYGACSHQVTDSYEIVSMPHVFRLLRNQNKRAEGWKYFDFVDVSLLKKSLTRCPFQHVYVRASYSLLSILLRQMKMISRHDLRTTTQLVSFIQFSILMFWDAKSSRPRWVWSEINEVKRILKDSQWKWQAMNSFCSQLLANISFIHIFFSP